MNSLTKGLALAALAVPALALTVFHGVESGVKAGGSVSAFEPYHVTGVDRGTNTCPVCKYGAEPAAQVWVNADDSKNVASIARALEAAIAKTATLWDVSERTTDLHAANPAAAHLTMPDVTLFERLFIADGVKICSVKLRKK